MNDSSLFTFALWVFAVAGSIYLVYGLLIRRPVIRELRRKIQDVRDRLELMVTAGVIADDHPAVVALRRRTQSAFATLHKVDVTHLALAGTLTPEVRAQIDEQVGKDKESIKAASQEVLALSKKLDLTVILALVVNSPCISGFSAAVGVFAAIFVGVGKVVNDVSSRAWEATYIERRTTQVAAA